MSVDIFTSKIFELQIFNSPALYYKEQYSSMVAMCVKFANSSCSFLHQGTANEGAYFPRAYPRFGEDIGTSDNSKDNVRREKGFQQYQLSVTGSFALLSCAYHTVKFSEITMRLTLFHATCARIPCLRNHTN